MAVVFLDRKSIEEFPEAVRIFKRKTKPTEYRVNEDIVAYKFKYRHFGEKEFAIASLSIVNGLPRIGIKKQKRLIF